MGPSTKAFPSRRAAVPGTVNPTSAVAERPGVSESLLQGRRRWLVWAVLAAGFGLVSFYRVSTAVIADDLARTFDVTGAELGLLHASFFYVYAALQLPSGILTDRFGVGRVAPGGLVALALGVLGFVTAATFLAGVASRAFMGLGGSVLYVATLRFCADRFRAEEFATMNGLTIAVSGVGALIATTPLAIAVDGLGWRLGLGIGGAVGVGLAVAVVIALRTGHHREHPGAAADPLGRSPASITGVIDASTGVLRARTTWVVGVAVFTVVGTNFAVFGLWGIPYLVQLYGLSVPAASTFVLVGNLGLILGPPALGWVADRSTPRTGVILASAAVFATSWGVIGLLSRPPLVIVGLCFFAAAFSFGGIALVYPVVKDIHPEVVSVATGTVNSLAYFGAAAFPPVMGMVLDVFWTGQTVAGTRVYTPLGFRIGFGIAALGGLVTVVCSAWLHARVPE